MNYNTLEILLSTNIYAFASEYKGFEKLSLKEPEIEEGIKQALNKKLSGIGSVKEKKQVES